jgi:outer membrane protein TolC
MIGRKGKARWVAAAIGIALVLTAALPASALDFDEALKRGIERSDRILAAKAAYDKARMQRWSSLGNFGPQLNVTARKLWLDVHNTFEMAPISLPPGYEQFADLFSAFDFSSFVAVPDHNDDLTLQAYQPITQLAQIGFYDRMARAGRDVAKLTYEVTRDQVALFLGQAYFNVLLAGKSVATYERALAQVDGLLRDGEAMAAQGLITKGDLLKFKMRHGDVELALLKARQDQELARALVARLLELPVEEVLCHDVEPVLADPGDLDRALADGKEGRRELRIVDLAEKVAKSARTAAYLSLLPSVGAVGSANWNDDGLDTTPDRTYAAGFALDWNFWAWGRDFHAARAADFDARRAKYESRSAATDILLSIEKAWRDDTVAHEAVRTQKATLDQAEENFRIEQSRYKVGKSTTTDLLGAQTQLTGAQTGYAAAQYGAVLADAALRVAVGRVPFPDMMGGKTND